MPTCQANHEIQVEGGYCSTCAKCQICGKPLKSVEYQWCLTERKPFTHPSCFTEDETSILNSETITVPKAIFDKLNAARLLFEPAPSDVGYALDHKGIQTQVNYYLVGKDFETIRAQVRRMESISSAMSLVLRKVERERSYSPEAEAKYWEHVEHERSIHAVKAPTTKNKVEKKILTKEDKVIETYMKLLGCSREEATEAAREAKEKAAARKRN